MGISDRNEGDAIRNAIEWIREHVELRESTSAESLYDHMESQSGEQLPVIHFPFDGRRQGDFEGSGSILDYVAVAAGGRVLRVTHDLRHAPGFGTLDDHGATSQGRWTDWVAGLDKTFRLLYNSYCQLFGWRTVPWDARGMKTLH